MSERTLSERFRAPAIVGRLLDNPVTLAIARICIAAPFLVAGIDKLFDWRGGQAEMLQVGLSPAWAFNLAALITELLGSALVILNVGTWLGAGALGVFTVLSTFLAHRFWELSGAARTAQLNSFLEHATISAAFIMVVVVQIRGTGSRQRNRVETAKALPVAGVAVFHAQTD
jgi:transmembrane protein